MMEDTFGASFLQPLDPAARHSFKTPSKQINDHQDVTTFLSSLAYKDIITFVLQLNRAMVPSKFLENGMQKIQMWQLASDAIEFSEPVRRLQLLLTRLESIIDEVPPDTGPRRFGNVSFRKWYQEMEARAETIMDECLPSEVLESGGEDPEAVTAKMELMAYFTGSFGSSQRLDYGTGHELSFVAFLGCLWKLNAFAKSEPGVEERGIVVGVIEPYLKLVRRLITTYTLEPAGSHGVWGLDDHSFIPYILGSAQLAPAIAPSDRTPIEGSIDGAPKTSDVTKPSIVERERRTNLYFSAIGFIYDVKKGPFWEHSPMLYDISGIKDGWGKINKGMIKMYNAEVLSKFPVVQHFPFGSLFRWERDPNAAAPLPSPHLSSRPQPSQTMAPPLGGSRPVADASTRAPWATTSSSFPQGTAQSSLGPTGPGYGGLRNQAMPQDGSTHLPPPTQAPWAMKAQRSREKDPDITTTKAPWAKK
ncbi:serine/threonine-protein phosphatase 2A activator 1 [Coccidioides immitis H538.4]|uniref:Serine/threonine-protein phosphatase 2A activator n=1 Tax=Coccidioides immitis H538.4 TaxID=396776 RepID=A0A0J8U9R2_COCIT|nr:serine/threonine-protein phosphatase 2A activator 1 [Coccidioides immitis H538.4]